MKSQQLFEEVLYLFKHAIFAAGTSNIGYCRDTEIRVLCQCKCQDGLGMEDFSIPDSALSSSNTLNPLQYNVDDTAFAGRLNQNAAILPTGEYYPVGAWYVDPYFRGPLSDQWLQVMPSSQYEYILASILIINIINFGSFFYLSSIVICR